MEKNDYELVFLAQEGNEDAINMLYQKYKPIIIKKSRRAIVFASHHGIEINDIMQEGYIGLDEAIKNFSQETDASFYTFALLCIDRQIANYLRKVNGGKDRILNEAVSINDSLEKTLDAGTNLELHLMGKDANKEMVAIMQKVLTNFEKEVFNMRLQGYSIDEIAKKLNKDSKAIYNTFWRIKEKIKKNVKIDD